ncbi:MAG: HD domain-containing phosphohydrolase [Acidimicrobiales bacterium]
MRPGAPPNADHEFLETLQTTAPIGIGFIDRDYRVVRVNDRLAAMLGQTPEDQIGRSMAELIPDLWDRVEPIYRRVLEQGEPILNLEVTVPPLHPGGPPRYGLVSNYPVWAGDEVIGAGVIVVDITERKANEQAYVALTQAAVGAIAAAVEARDPYTAGHQRKVSELAAAIAGEMGLDDHEIEGIRLAASIHDIGKISIPSEILSKPSRLTPTEQSLVREHAGVGSDIVHGIDFPWPIAGMIRQHHERMDGSGYPDGLTSDEILVGARVIAVADVVDAMASHRPYRPSRGLEDALRQIESERGTTLDADVVDACMRLFRHGGIDLDKPWMR